MTSTRPLVIDSDTDSVSESDCIIDEGRSAPPLDPNLSPRTVTYLGPAGPGIPYNPPQARQLQARLPVPALCPEPRRGGSGEPVRNHSQLTLKRPSVRSNSKVKSPSPRRKVQASPLGSVQLRAPISKLSSTQKDYSDRHVDRRGDRRCEYCEEDARCCDGEAPCACCLSAGFVCSYPGEEPIFPPSDYTPEVIESEQDTEMSSSDEWTADYESEQVSNALDQLQVSRSSSSKTSSSFPSNGSESAHQGGGRASRLQASAMSDATEDEALESDNAEAHKSNTGNEKNVSITTPMDLDEQSDSESYTSDSDSDTSNSMGDIELLELGSVPTTLWLPNSFEEVKKLIQIHELNIASHREYIVEAQLANAKLTAKRNMHINGGQRGDNPFKRMIADQRRIASTTPTQPILTMKVKARRNDYTNLRVVVEVLDEDKAAHIPEYKSIGRLRSVFLARNVHGLKFVPYNPGIEEKDLDTRRKDLEIEFKDHSSEEFRRQRECLESVYQWSDDFDEILQELRITQQQLWKCLLDADLAWCQKCETSCENLPTLALRGITLSKAEKQRCQWLYQAMTKITQIGVWHFISSKPGQIDKKQDRMDPVQNKENFLCSLCFTHNCLTHGSFKDKKIVKGEAVINDPELQNNQRQKTVLKVVGPRAPPHTCCLYCLPEWWAMAGDDLQEIIGLGNDGQLTGLRNKGVTMLIESDMFPGDRLCEKVCFLEKSNRIIDGSWDTKVIENFTNRDRSKKELVISLSKVYSSHLRLPCMIGKILGVECTTALHVLLRLVNEDHAQAKRYQESSAMANTENRKVPTRAAGYSTAKSLKIEGRKTWVPCSHEGPCLPSTSNCACARDQVHCETSCGCSDNCRRRFKGCKCKKTCFTDDRCECHAANRECDPILCRECGVEEVLDPSNKYRDDIRNGRCRNNRIQLDLPPRTVKGVSEVQGWGLFLGADLPAHSFIGEYKGENISESESNRRGAIYAYVSQEYLFNLNEDNQLDGSRFGNKTRFINSSKKKEHMNVYPKVMFVNGVTRIGLFTSRVVKAGEELLYDYGYPPELVQGEFWEKHDKTILQDGVITPIPRPKFRHRMAKNAADTLGQEEGEEEEDDDEEGSQDDPIPSSVPNKTQAPSKGRGKRRLEEISADSDEEQTHARRNASAQDSTDGSAYAEDEQLEASSGEEVDNSEDELSIPTRRVASSRTTRDRRRGGEAQRRAAETRKRNKNETQGK